MSIISDAFAIELLTALLRIRRVEEEIARRYSEKKMRCPTHLSIGQEAIAVGVCKAALQSDYVLSNHRCHAHYLAKGGNLKAMLAEIYGKASGSSSGRGGSMHLVDLEVGFLASTPIVGGTIPVAAGVAFHQYLHNRSGRVISFLGEGATEEGIFCETLNFSALKNLPILFVCENNFYSVYSPLEVRQPLARDRLKIVAGHGIKTFSVIDGNDLEEVYTRAFEALRYIDEKKKPAYIEFVTYRFKEHCGPNEDDHLNYRPKEQVAHFLQRCPVKRYKKKLREKGLLDEEQLEEMESRIKSEIHEAFLFAENDSFPNRETTIL